MKTKLINEVIYLEQSGFKVKKNEMPDVIVKLAEQGGDITLLAQLYSHFMPKQKNVKQVKTDFEWVALAVADKKDVRFYLQYVYSDGEFIYGTDGHRLHRAKTDLEQGFYHPITQDKVVVDARFPDAARLFKYDETEYKSINADTLETGILETGTTKTRIKKNDIFGVSEKYLNEALAGFEENNILIKDGMSLIHIDNDNRSAVIMPVRC